MNVHRLIMWVGGALAVAVVLLALVVSAFRIIVPHVPEYRDEVSAWAGRLLGAPVDIETMDLQWRRARPELILTGVRFVSADARHAFAAREVRVGLSVYGLTRGRVVPARVVFVEPDLTLDVEAAEAGGGEGWRRAFGAREHRGEVVVERGRASVLLEGGRRRVDFDAVDARIASDGQHHTARVSARPGGLDAAVNGEFTARGWPGQRDWRADGIVGVRGLDLVAAQRFSGIERLEGGRVDASLALTVVGDTQRASGEVGLSGVRWTDAAGAQRIERAVAEGGWTRRGKGWHADIRRVVVARGDGVRESGPLSVRRDGALHVSAQSVHVEDLAVFAIASPVREAVLEEWVLRRPRGMLREVTLAIADGQAVGHAKAAGLALDAAPASRVPGFSGVGVDAVLRAGEAELAVAVADGTFDLPRTFRAPFPISSARATARWRATDDGWALTLDDAAVRSPAVRAQGVAEFEHRHGEEPMLVVRASFEDTDLTAGYPYLPVSVMNPNLVEWLDHAVISGSAPSGRFTYDGAASGAALREGRSALVVAFRADDVTLWFADGWPVLEHATADVEFTGRAFSARVSAGALASAAVTSAEVGIADYSDAELVVHARSDARLAALLAALRETPVGDAAWARGIDADGTAELDLRVALRFRGAVPQVRGTLAFDDARIVSEGFPHALTAARGALAITEDGADARGIAGMLLGRRATGSVTTLRDTGGVARGIEIALDGEVDASTLAQLTGAGALPVSGAARWHARVFGPYGDGLMPYLEVESTLEGLAVDLPAPLGKAADDSRPVTLHADLAGGIRQFAVDAGPVLQATGALVADDGHWRVESAHVHVGDAPPRAVPDGAVAVTGALERWTLGGLGDTAHGGTGPLTFVDVEFGELVAFGRALGRTRVTGERGDDAWSFAIDGERVLGNVDLPDAPSDETPVRAVFDQFALDAVKPVAAADAAPLDANALPPMTFHAARFRVGPVTLGEVNATLHRIENGVRLERFSSTSRELRIVGDATWHTVEGHHRTTARATFDSPDVRRALAALGYAGSVDASAGHIEFDVEWLGSPIEDPRPLLNGSVRVRVERGTLYEVQPGAGRMFGLLSVNALPRRLSLDFSDVYRRGLAFDSISGSFRLTDGNAYTDDLRLSGPAARVEIKGRAGLAARDYDQEAVVVASLASSLAIAGTLAGGPGVGAAMLIASEILRGPLEDMARVRYRVKGTWEHPVVERVSEPR